MLEHAEFIYPLCHDLGLILSRLFISSFLFLTPPRSFDFINSFFFFRLPKCLGHILFQLQFSTNSWSEHWFLFFLFFFFKCIVLKWCFWAFDHEEGVSFSKNLLHHIVPKHWMARWRGETFNSKVFGRLSPDLDNLCRRCSAFQHRDLALISSLPLRCSRLDTCSVLLTVDSAYLLISISTLLWTWHHQRTTASPTRSKISMESVAESAWKPHPFSHPHFSSVMLHLFNLDLCCSRIVVYSPPVREAAAQMHS